MALSKNTENRLRNQIQVLQQLQRLLAVEATLADVKALLMRVEADYGAESLLEDVIQHLLARHLVCQIEQRDATRCHA